MIEDSDQESAYWRTVVCGGVTGMLVTTLVHPLDLVKVRMQLYPGPISTDAMTRKILRCEGIPALYNGLSAAYHRQLTFTTTRLAVYYGLHEKYTQFYGVAPGLADTLKIGVYSALIGGLAGNPSEVALVRIMSDCKKDPCNVKEGTKQYRGAFHALYKIWQDEGFCALWRGGSLTLTRAACISIVQVRSYAETKEYFRDSLSEHNDVRIHTFAAFVSGFLTAVITLPVDTLKTNYQIRSDSTPQRKVFLDLLKVNGVLSLWPGFFPYFLRLSLHTALTPYVLNHIYVLFRLLGVFPY